jgi:hypothetical protein
MVSEIRTEHKPTVSKADRAMAAGVYFQAIARELQTVGIEHFGSQYNPFHLTLPAKKLLEPSNKELWEDDPTAWKVISGQHLAAGEAVHAAVDKATERVIEDRKLSEAQAKAVQFAGEYFAQQLIVDGTDLGMAGTSLRKPLTDIAMENHSGWAVKFGFGPTVTLDEVQPELRRTEVMSFGRAADVVAIVQQEKAFAKGAQGLGG